MSRLPGEESRGAKPAPFQGRARSAPEEQLSGRWIRTAASQGALVWWIYAVVETALLVGVPRARLALTHAFPDNWPAWPLPELSALLTAVVLVAYPALGAALNVLVAGSTSRTTLPGRVASDDSTFWSSVAEAALVVAFALNVLWSRQIPVLAAVVAPLVLAFVRMRLAFRATPPGLRHDLTHPVTVVTLLVGGAFAAQPRPLGPAAFPLLVASGCAALLLLAVAAVSRLRRGSFPIGLVPSGVRGRVGAAALSCGLVAVTLPQGTRRPVVERPAPSRRRADTRPNVVLVTWDAVRADHLSLYGYPRDTTPFLRRLAGEGATVYTNAVATSNWTLPTHASLFTGLPPIRHGANRYLGERVVSRISGAAATLAELLARVGYRTGGIAANSVVLVPEFGFDRGFSLWDSTGSDAPFPWEIRPYLLRGAARACLSTVVSRRDPEARFADADEINERARRFLEGGRAAGQPFFLFLNFMDAHDPYVPPAPFANRFPGRDARFRWVNLQGLLDGRLRLSRPLAPGDRDHLTSQYDGAISYLDDRLNRLLDVLRRLGLYENTLIIVTADHGEGLGEKGLLLHGTSLYQDQVHVPLVVKYPNEAVRESIDATVSGADVFPTVLEAAGIPVPGGLEARSLRLARSAGRRWVFSESYEADPGARSPGSRTPSLLAAFSGTVKRIIRSDGTAEVYDLAADPAESRDLGAAGPPPEDLSTELSRYLRPLPGIRNEDPVDPEAIARLRALGYVE